MTMLGCLAYVDGRHASDKGMRHAWRLLHRTNEIQDGGCLVRRVTEVAEDFE